jgi:hypothetical protein
MRLLGSLCVALLLLAPPLAWQRHHRAHAATPPRSAFERALDGVAREISGRPEVRVRCVPLGAPGLLGLVLFYRDGPGDEALLAPQVCETLRELWTTRRTPSLGCTALGAGQCGEDVIELAWAASALAHESHHLRGVQDEAAAECYGLQSTALAAERMGAPPAEARRLEEYTFWNVRPPVDRGYFSPECRDGGALDLHPGSPIWP